MEEKEQVCECYGCTSQRQLERDQQAWVAKRTKEQSWVTAWMEPSPYTAYDYRAKEEFWRGFRAGLLIMVILLVFWGLFGLREIRNGTPTPRGYEYDE